MNESRWYDGEIMFADDAAHSCKSPPMTWVFRLVLGLTLVAWLGGVGVAPSAFAAGTQEIVALLQADPRNVAALNAWGIEQARVGDLIGAIRTWRHAIDIAPDYVHLYNNIGSALRRLGHTDASLDWYQASLRVQPTYWTWFNLGLLHEDGGKREEARVAYREALRLCPSFTQAEERLWRLNRLADEAAAKPPVALALPPVTREPVQAAPAPSPVPESRPQPVAKPVVKPAPVPADELEAPPMDQVRLPGDDGGQVFLTFDGGADADGLVPILEALRGRGLKSTFFLTGQWVTSFPDLARRILAEGHEIANHSMRHPDMAGWGKERIADELGKAEEAMNFYAVHREKPFYADLVAFMSSGDSVVLLLERENAIVRWREVMGATDPAKAAPGTLRRLYGFSIERNAVHGSDARDTAAAEIGFFFKS